MNFKNFLLNCIFTPKQVDVIWQALIYSEYKYRQHNDVDGAVKVQKVIEEVKHIFGCVKKSYTEEDVKAIVKNVLKEAHDEAEKLTAQAFKNGVKLGRNIDKSSECEVIDKAKCEKCEHHDTCVVYEAICDVEKDEAQNVEGEDVQATTGDATASDGEAKE